MGRMKKARANNLAKKNAERKRELASNRRDESSDEMDDDIDKFHKNRDKVPLEATDSEDEEFENPVFDLKAAQSESELEEDEDDMDEEELDELASKIAKQAKIMRQKTGVIDDEENEEEEAEEERKGWGKKKSFYYNADNVDFDQQSSDEEGPALEEAEARRLQKENAESFRPEDFGQQEEDSDEEVEEERKEDLIPIEKVKKDLDSLSSSERMQVLMSNAPELVGLLDELKEAIHELDHKIEPLLRKVESGVIATKEGKNYVELKHMLLLSYCQSIVFYLLLKAEGKSVCDHPVIGRLVDIRMLLEKIRQIDGKLQKQVEAVMSLDRPPARDAMIHEEDVQLARGITSVPQVERAPVVEELKAATIGEESKRMLRELERLEERAKSDRLLEQENAGPSGKRSFQDLDYDEAGVEQSEKQHTKISRVIAEAGKRQKKSRIVSGDVDLPVKEDIGDRRRKHELQQPHQSELMMEPDSDDAKSVEPKGKRQAEVLKPAVESREEELHEGKRRISYEIEKNRGLTPHRKKADKNPRKKYKTKHGKAVVRRKGMVRDIRKQTGPYEGERTGIRTDISRSIRFKG